MRVDASGPVEEMAAGRAEIMTRAEIRALQQQQHPQNHRNQGYYGDGQEEDTLSASGVGGDNVSLAPSELTSAEWQLGSVEYPQRQVEASLPCPCPCPLSLTPFLLPFHFLFTPYIDIPSLPLIHTIYSYHALIPPTYLLPQSLPSPLLLPQGVESTKEIGRKEKMLFEFGCKTTFRDRQVTHTPFHTPSMHHLTHPLCTL